MSKAEIRKEYSDIHSFSETLLLPMDQRGIDRLLQIRLFERVYEAGTSRVYVEFTPMIQDHERKSAIVDHMYDGQGIDRPQNSMVELWQWEKSKHDDHFGVQKMFNSIGLTDEIYEDVKSAVYRLHKAAKRENWISLTEKKVHRQKLGHIYVDETTAIFIYLQEYLIPYSESEYRFSISLCGWVGGEWKRVQHVLKRKPDELEIDNLPGLGIKTREVIDLAKKMYGESLEADFTDMVSNFDVAKQFESIRPL